MDFGFIILIVTLVALALMPEKKYNKKKIIDKKSDDVPSIFNFIPPEPVLLTTTEAVKAYNKYAKAQGLRTRLSDPKDVRRICALQSMLPKESRIGVKVRGVWRVNRDRLFAYANQQGGDDE